MEPRAELRRERVHPQMRDGAGLVPQRDERVVVGQAARAVRGELGAGLSDRAEQLHGLVDEVGAEVEEDAAALGSRGFGFPARTDRGLVPFEPRFEAAHRAEPACRDELADRAEVAVPAPVLEDRQSSAEPLGVRD